MKRTQTALISVSDKSNLKFFKVDGSKSVEKVFEEISNQI